MATDKMTFGSPAHLAELRRMEAAQRPAEAAGVDTLAELAIWLNAFGSATDLAGSAEHRHIARTFAADLQKLQWELREALRDLVTRCDGEEG